MKQGSWSIYFAYITSNLPLKVWVLVTIVGVVLSGCGSNNDVSKQDVVVDPQIETSVTTVVATTIPQTDLLTDTPMQIVVPEFDFQSSTSCSNRPNNKVIEILPYQINLPFDESDCRSIVRFFDLRMVLLGAGGEMVPAHTAQLAVRSKVTAPISGNIRFRKMQSDLPAGYHLYGAGALRIQIIPTDPSGNSIKYNPVIHLYVPGDSEIAEKYLDLPRESAGAKIARGDTIVSSISDGALDPEAKHNHNLIMFYEADGEFVDVFGDKRSEFLIDGVSMGR